MTHKHHTSLHHTYSLKHLEALTEVAWNRYAACTDNEDIKAMYARDYLYWANLRDDARIEEGVS